MGETYRKLGKYSAEDLPDSSTNFNVVVEGNTVSFSWTNNHALSIGNNIIQRFKNNQWVDIQSVSISATNTQVEIGDLGSIERFRVSILHEGIYTPSILRVVDLSEPEPETELPSPEEGQVQYELLDSANSMPEDWNLDANWSRSGDGLRYDWTPQVIGTYRATSNAIPIYDAEKILFDGQSGNDNLRGYESDTFDIRIIMRDADNEEEYVFQERLGITSDAPSITFDRPLVWNVPEGFGENLQIIFEFEDDSYAIASCLINRFTLTANVSEELLSEPEPEPEGYETLHFELQCQEGIAYVLIEEIDCEECVDPHYFVVEYGSETDTYLYEGLYEVKIWHNAEEPSGDPDFTTVVQFQLEGENNIKREFCLEEV